MNKFLDKFKDYFTTHHAEISYTNVCPTCYATIVECTEILTTEQFDEMLAEMDKFISENFKEKNE